jgi:nucleoside-diphosphate-sugar epimerase
MPSKGLVFVTGASGFIGGHVVETLHLTGRRPVRAGFRQWASCARLGRFPLDLQQVDLLDPASIERALAGADAIVHCAQGSRDVIVEGTRNVLDAARRLGIGRVVHLSSCVVYGLAAGDVDESRPLQYTGDPYTDAKIDAEKACQDAVRRGVPVVVLRPPLVYGPWGADWTIKMTRRVIQGMWGPSERHGDGRCNLVYVEDLMRAVLCAMDSDAGVGEAFNVNGPEAITWSDYFRRIRAGLGLPDVRPVPSWRARLKVGVMAPTAAFGSWVRAHHMDTVRAVAARFEPARRAMKLAERLIRGTPSPEEFALFDREVVYRTHKASTVLGWTPRITVDEGLKMTNAWVRAQGLV